MPESGIRMPNALATLRSDQRGCKDGTSHRGRQQTDGVFHNVPFPPRASIVRSDRPRMMTASDWLTGHAELLPSTGSALDLACGRGRHALWLAERGLRTCAVDRDPERLALNDEARARGVPLEANLSTSSAATAFPGRWEFRELGVAGLEL